MPCDGLRKVLVGAGKPRPEAPRSGGFGARRAREPRPYEPLPSSDMVYLHPNTARLGLARAKVFELLGQQDQAAIQAPLRRLG
jgi:hypothetical protein